MHLGDILSGLILLYSLRSAVTVESSLEGLTCNEEYSFGYNYRLFHKISDITMNRTDGFRLDFKVRAGSNAHIFFCENPYPAREAVYEVVLGAGRNTYSDIRRGKGTASKVKASTVNIVSSVELRGFWIYIHNDGRIMVGKEDDDLPFLMWRDPSPIRVNFFAFTTWKDVYGKWYYKCKKNQDEKPEEDDIVTRPLTMTQKLRQDILPNYDPYIAPKSSDPADSKRTSIYVHLASDHVYLDEQKSILNVHGTLSMSWMDDKLRWNPDDYGNLTSIVLYSHEIWIPDIILFNSAAPPSVNYNSGLQDVGLIVSANGNVFWAPQASYKAFCEELDFRNWPKDIQTCDLRLGFWSQQHLLQLLLMDNGTLLGEQITGTEWKMINMSAETMWIPTPWASAAINLGMDSPLLEDGNDLVDPVATNEFGELEIVIHSSMAIKFTLMRKNSGYNTVLLIPLSMILLCTLLSFWASPFGSSKLALQCLSLVTTVLFLLATWKVLPAHANYVPSIIAAYRGIMVMICLSMTSSVLIINFTRYAPLKHFSPILSQLLTSPWMSYIFCLPENEDQVNKRYNTLNDSQQLNEDLLEKDNSTDYDLQWSWILLSVFIDRFMFFIYSILFVYIFTTFV